MISTQTQTLQSNIWGGGLFWHVKALFPLTKMGSTTRLKLFINQWESIQLRLANQISVYEKWSTIDRLFTRIMVYITHHQVQASLLYETSHYHIEYINSPWLPTELTMVVLCKFKFYKCKNFIFMMQIFVMDRTYNTGRENITL